MKKTINFLRVFLWKCISVFYFPIYAFAWILHKIARFMLAIAYLGLLEKQMSKDIIKYLFKWHGKH